MPTVCFTYILSINTSPKNQYWDPLYVWFLADEKSEVQRGLGTHLYSQSDKWQRLDWNPVCPELSLFVHLLLQECIFRIFVQKETETQENVRVCNSIQPTAID